jgi:hypothetical protein
MPDGSESRMGFLKAAMAGGSGSLMMGMAQVGSLGGVPTKSSDLAEMSIAEAADLVHR